MACAYVLGLPLVEDADCADDRRNDRTKRKKVRQDGKTDRTESRQDGKSDRTASRTAPGATTPAANILAASAGPLAAVADVAAMAINPLAGFFGGNTTDPSSPDYFDPMPILIGGGILLASGIAFAISRS